MKAVVCDLCLKPVKGPVSGAGIVIKQDYCEKCIGEIRAIYASVEKLQEDCQEQWSSGLRKLIEKFNKKHPDTPIADFAWLP